MNPTLSSCKTKLNINWVDYVKLETSAFEMSASISLYGGQFTLLTQLIKPNYLVILPTDVSPQFLQKLTPL